MLTKKTEYAARIYAQLEAIFDEGNPNFINRADFDDPDNLAAFIDGMQEACRVIRDDVRMAHRD